MKTCKQCQGEITSKHAKIFCSRSCAATYNNTGVHRHGRPPHKCAGCDNIIPGIRKWCSNACQSEHSPHRKYRTEEEKLAARRKRQREIFMRYYSKKKYQTPHDADLTAIKEFYMNCPDGYEVDHIIPISRGGAHSIENLQYLTVTENRRKGNRLT